MKPLSEVVLGRYSETLTAVGCCNGLGNPTDIQERQGEYTAFYIHTPIELMICTKRNSQYKSRGNKMAQPQ